MFQKELVGHTILEIKQSQASSALSVRGFDNSAVACARPQKPKESKDECNPVFPRKQTSTQFHCKVN